VDVLSFVVSAWFLRAIHAAEVAPARPEKSASLMAEMAEALRFVVQHALLRPITVTTATFQLFGGMFDALLVLFVARELHLAPAAVGVFYAIGSASGLIGAMLGNRLTKRIGIGRMVVASPLALGMGWMVISLSRGTPALASAIIGTGFLLAGIGNALYNISTVSLVQAIAPDRLRGRVHATDLFIGWGVLCPSAR
jgi:predicted MFS family arabinose efflux permease